jgi:hypothetical protein
VPGIFSNRKVYPGGGRDLRIAPTALKVLSPGADDQFEN